MEYVLEPALQFVLKFVMLGKNKIKITVSRNLRQAHLQKVGLTQISGDHETLSIVCHVGLHVDFSFMKSSLGLSAFTFVCEVNLGWSPPFRPMRALRLQWVTDLQSCV
jgi:hypothetical protein